MIEQLSVEQSDTQATVPMVVAGCLEGEFADWFSRTFRQPAFRARQVYRWVHQENVFDPVVMSDLPAMLRVKLADELAFIPLKLVVARASDAGLTTKALFSLQDGSTIESVLMRYPAGADSRERNTVCVSSQVGCAVGCPFCATGLAGLKRSLTSAEIVGQILYMQRLLRDQSGGAGRVSNVVFMGEGEPLANLDQVLKAIEILNSPSGMGLGARRIVVSTSGLAPGIRRLAEQPLQVGLALSLHAPEDEARDKLVPVNRRYPIKEALAACSYYSEKTGRRVSYEYVMIAGVNDSDEQATALGRLLAGSLSHVNLIPLNEVKGSPFHSSAWPRIRSFQQIVRLAGISCTVRSERGDPIDAACGQLRSTFERRLPLSQTSSA